MTLPKKRMVGQGQIQKFRNDMGTTKELFNPIKLYFPDYKVSAAAFRMVWENSPVEGGTMSSISLSFFNWVRRIENLILNSAFERLMNGLTEYLDCMCRPETGTMVCRWLREVTPAEMRASYKYLFVEAQGIGSRLWLLDIRRCNNEDPKTAQWLRNKYMPMLAAHFGGPTFLAYLLSPVHLMRVENHAVSIKHVAQLQRSVYVDLFIEEGAANAWLVQQVGK